MHDPLKPAAETPLTALAVTRLLNEAGVPPGVVNVITTDEPASIVASWLEDSRVRKLSFTGSTGVGRNLLRQAADRVLDTSMELGGNAAFILAEDADVMQAVAGAMSAKFRNNGQACTAANRFFVHASRIAEFTSAFEVAVGRLRVGPASSGSDLGPLISAQAQSRVQSLVEQTLDRGARASITQPLPNQGYFCSSVILSDVPDDAPILEQEIFGPVAPVVVWEDTEDLLEWVNGSELGLASYVYARNLKDALHLAERIEAGMVGINRGSVSDPAAPFGGVKESDLGREGARDGIQAFQEKQFYSVDWS